MLNVLLLLVIKQLSYNLWLANMLRCEFTAFCILSMVYFYMCVVCLSLVSVCPSVWVSVREKTEKSPMTDWCNLVWMSFMVIVDWILVTFNHLWSGQLLSDFLDKNITYNLKTTGWFYVWIKIGLYDLDLDLEKWMEVHRFVLYWNTV